MSVFRPRLPNTPALRLLFKGLEISPAGFISARPAVHPSLVVSSTLFHIQQLVFVFLLSTVWSHAQTIPVNLSLVMKFLVHKHSPVLLIQICFIKLGASVESLGGNAAVLLCLP